VKVDVIQQAEGRNKKRICFDIKSIDITTQLRFVAISDFMSTSKLDANSLINPIINIMYNRNNSI
jgi:hypothetical protein